MQSVPLLHIFYFVAIVFCLSGHSAFKEFADNPVVQAEFKKAAIAAMQQQQNMTPAEESLEKGSLTNCIVFEILEN